MTHPQLVAALVKPGEQIKNEITAKEAHELHMIMGLSGEVGELLDAVKKAIIYRKSFDRENAVEELGDIEFYLEGLRSSLGISREETLEANTTKLLKRYSSLSYSNEQANQRADKNV